MRLQTALALIKEVKKKSEAMGFVTIYIEEVYSHSMHPIDMIAYYFNTNPNLKST